MAVIRCPGNRTLTVSRRVLRLIKIRKKSVIDVDSILFQTKNVLPSGLSGCRWRRNGFNHQHMKKRVITLGVAALGVAGAQAADGKLWEVSASLKGFYDDNYTTSPDDLAEESWGIEVSPGLSLSYGQGTDLEIKPVTHMGFVGTTTAQATIRITAMSWD